MNSSRNSQEAVLVATLGAEPQVISLATGLVLRREELHNDRQLIPIPLAPHDLFPPQYAPYFQAETPDAT